MDIRSSLDGLKTLLGSDPGGPAAAAAAKSGAGCREKFAEQRQRDAEQRRQRGFADAPPKAACARTRWPRFRQHWQREPTTCRRRRWRQDGGRHAGRRQVGVEPVRTASKTQRRMRWSGTDAG